ncbi:hypothetical protein ILUMI_03895 [Ignelater luminosus]|uniref:CRAL-TRIO domain-containing protein n=1 Tax=Ignelater luminosus TaxID=2038154 RepID=A0A8K0DFQ2_IGNLU|nr:hypothetical protein ILUMI_03895 [Ignelater luminosus]
MTSEGREEVIDSNGEVLTAEDIAKRLQELRELVIADNKLKGIRMDDNYLVRFLYCCDFNVQEAFKRLQEFHNMVKENPDWFTCLSPLERRVQIETQAKVMLPCKDKDGRAVYLCRIGKVDAGSSDPKQEAQLDEMWFEAILNDSKAMGNGISIVIDINGYSWKLFRWLTPTNLKMATKAIQLFPCKEFIFHVVNNSFLLKASVNIAWPFMSEDIKKRIKFHFGDWSSLHEHISPEVLPPEYGGRGPAINFEKLAEWFFDQDARIREYLKYRQLSLQ